MTSSNIPKIIERLKRWQEGLPAAISRAFSPEYWVPKLKMVTRATLQAQLAQWSGWITVDENVAAEVVGMIQNFVESVRGNWSGNMASFSAIWSEAGVNISRVSANQETLFSTGQYALDLDQESLERAKQAVAEWVAKEKVLSEQDGYDVDRATERVQSILGLIAPTNPAAMAGWLASPERKDAADRLAAKVQEFVARQSGGSAALNADVIYQWLSAVMLAWREYIRLHLRDRIEVEMNRLTAATRL